MQNCQYKQLIIDMWLQMFVRPKWLSPKTLQNFLQTFRKNLPCGDEIFATLPVIIWREPTTPPAAPVRTEPNLCDGGDEPLITVVCPPRYACHLYNINYIVSVIRCREEGCIGLNIPDDQEISHGPRDALRNISRAEGNLEVESLIHS